MPTTTTNSCSRSTARHPGQPCQPLPRLGSGLPPLAQIHLRSSPEATPAGETSSGRSHLFTPPPHDPPSPTLVGSASGLGASSARGASRLVGRSLVAGASLGARPQAPPTSLRGASRWFRAPPTTTRTDIGLGPGPLRQQPRARHHLRPLQSEAGLHAAPHSARRASEPPSHPCRRPPRLRQLRPRPRSRSALD